MLAETFWNLFRHIVSIRDFHKRFPYAISICYFRKIRQIGICETCAGIFHTISIRLPYAISARFAESEFAKLAPAYSIRFPYDFHMRFPQDPPNRNLRNLRRHPIPMRFPYAISICDFRKIIESEFAKLAPTSDWIIFFISLAFLPVYGFRTILTGFLKQNSDLDPKKLDVPSVFAGLWV